MILFIIFTILILAVVGLIGVAMENDLGWNKRKPTSGDNKPGPTPDGPGPPGKVPKCFNPGPCSKVIVPKKPVDGKCGGCPGWMCPSFLGLSTDDMANEIVWKVNKNGNDRTTYNLSYNKSIPNIPGSTTPANPITVLVRLKILEAPYVINIPVLSSDAKKINTKVIKVTKTNWSNSNLNFNGSYRIINDGIISDDPSKSLYIEKNGKRIKAVFLTKSMQRLSFEYISPLVVGFINEPVSNKNITFGQPTCNFKHLGTNTILVKMGVNKVCCTMPPEITNKKGILPPWYCDPTVIPGIILELLGPVLEFEGLKFTFQIGSKFLKSAIGTSVDKVSTKVATQSVEKLTEDVSKEATEKVMIKAGSEIAEREAEAIAVATTCENPISIVIDVLMWAGLFFDLIIGDPGGYNSFMHLDSFLKSRNALEYNFLKSRQTPTPSLNSPLITAQPPYIFDLFVFGANVDFLNGKKGNSVNLHQKIKNGALLAGSFTASQAMTVLSGSDILGPAFKNMSGKNLEQIIKTMNSQSAQGKQNIENIAKIVMQKIKEYGQFANLRDRGYWNATLMMEKILIPETPIAASKTDSSTPKECFTKVNSVPMQSGFLEAYTKLLTIKDNSKYNTRLFKQATSYNEFPELMNINTVDLMVTLGLGSSSVDLLYEDYDNIGKVSPVLNQNIGITLESIKGYPFYLSSRNLIPDINTPIIQNNVDPDNGTPLNFGKANYTEPLFSNFVELRDNFELYLLEGHFNIQIDDTNYKDDIDINLCRLISSGDKNPQKYKSFELVPGDITIKLPNQNTLLWVIYQQLMLLNNMEVRDGQTL
jgi:hypothetical protein